MATTQHSALTGSDLHECKGAASATSGQVPIATGSGTAVFGNLAYNDISGKPLVPSVSLSDVVVSSQPIIKTYLVTASAGVWTLAISGFATIHNVFVTAVSGGTDLGTAAIATLGTFSTASISGSVIVPSSTANALGTTQSVRITIIGV